MSEGKTLRVAIVGTGYIGGRHADALTAMDGVEIVAFVDVRREAAEAAAAKWGGAAYTSAAELLERETIDAAWLGLPPFAHGETERAFIKRGIPMYIEKPVAADLATAQELGMAIDEAKLLVNVGYYWRCMETTPILQALLAETPARLVRAAWHGLTPPAPWWQQQERSGGQIVEQATHLFDFARFVLAGVGEAEVLHAVGRRHEREEFPQLNVATVSSATLAFGPDTLGVFTATCVLDGTRDAGLEFFCDGRKISFNAKELVVETNEGRQVTPVGEDPLVIADRAFIAAIRASDASSLPCSYEEALRTQALCVGVSERIAEGLGGAAQ